MPYGFLDTLSTPSVKAAQAANGVLATWERFAGDRAFDAFTDAESEFIAARDSFYMASVSQSGWPYVQHRGGPPGFIRVVDDRTLAFPDFRGNRQYISVGNVAADDRISLIMVDYAARRRLKILGRMKTVELAEDPALAAALALPGYVGRPERAMVLALATFDWNCPQHITPRFTEAEVAEALAPARARQQALEAENAAQRARLAALGERDGEASG
jgi:predicted pyridoxine 5'-phosphate oxidase superfamily flavin-nucleotide-binding protein